MRTVPRIGQTFIATAIIAAALAPACFGQIQKPPELLVRLWPLYRSTRPSVSTAQTGIGPSGSEAARA